MNKQVEAYYKFVEEVNEDFFRLSNEECSEPLGLLRSGSYVALSLDLPKIICDSEEENLKDGISNIEDIIVGLRNLQIVLKDRFSKLNQDELDMFGVYDEEEEGMIQPGEEG